MASSLSRRLIAKLPQNPSLHPWFIALQTNNAYPRLPSAGDPFIFSNASSLISTSRFPAENHTETQSNFVRSFPVCVSENHPFHKPEPSNQTIPLAKPRINTPTFFKPYWVSSQTSFLATPTGLKPDSTRHFSKSRPRSPKNQNLRNPQNPSQNPKALNDKVESEKPLPRRVEKTLEECEKKFGLKGDALSKDYESRKRGMFKDFEIRQQVIDEIRKRFVENANHATVDARQVKRVLEGLRKNIRDLSWSLGLLGVAHFGPWVYNAIYTGEVLSLSSWAAFAFPSSLAFLAWRVLKPMDMFERRADQDKMSLLARAISVSGEMETLFLRFRMVALLCILAACAQPLLAHVLAELK